MSSCKIWLQSMDFFDDLALYDVLDRTYELTTRKKLGDEVPDIYDGSFAFLSGQFCALYVLADKLYVAVDEQHFHFDDDVEIALAGPPERRVLQVSKDGREQVRVSYRVDMSRLIPNDPTPFIEAEDFDYGLFLSNISGDPARKRVLLGLE